MSYANCLSIMCTVASYFLEISLTSFDKHDVSSHIIILEHEHVSLMVLSNFSTIDHSSGKLPLTVLKQQ